jgi:hypothetical protein
MKTWVRKTLSVGVLAAGALLLAPGAAHAGTHQDSSGNVGFGNGYQYVAPVNIPLNIVGNADSAFGFSSAAGSVVNRTEGGKGGGGVSQDSSQNVGYFNGAQAYYPVNVPITVAGNAGSFFGISNAAASVSNGGSQGKHKNKKESGHVTEGGWVDQDSSQNVGFFNGAQSYSPVDIPINICGNSFSFLGETNAAASCGDVDADKGHKGHKGTKGHKHDDTAADNGKDDYAGDNGDQDGQYMGDHGHKPGDDTAGDNGDAADNGDKYGSKDGGRTGQESTSIDSLTQGFGGGFDLLNTLR